MFQYYVIEYVIYYNQALEIMKENPFGNKSYKKSKENRMKFRHEIFQKNRNSNTLSYLSFYEEQTRQQIKKSLEGPLPPSLPASCYAVRSTISYYRRNSQPVYKTRLQPEAPLDPHMTYESLLSFLSLEQDKIPNYQTVAQEFSRDLSSYLSMPFQQIREVAAMAAGNHILGKQSEILQIVKQNQNHLWVMINHIYQRNVHCQYLHPYILNNSQKAYRAIYELTNNKKDQIIYSIISDEQLVTAVMNNLKSQNAQLQQYSIRIIGNILAQAQDYASELTKYHLLECIFPLLNNKSENIRREGCWLLANYAFQPAAANQMLWKQNLIQRLLIMSKNESNIKVKTQIYYIFTHLIKLGDKNTTYKMALQQNFLQQCMLDLEIEDQTLTQIILSFIYELLNLGEEFCSFEEDGMGIEDNCNPFAQEIKSSSLKSMISGKTFNENNMIRQLSSEILDRINKNDEYFGMI